MSKLSFVIFIVIALSVYVAMHWFVYWRLAAGLSLAADQRLVLKVILIAGALAFIAGEFVIRLAPVYPLLAAGSIWLGIIAISLAVFLAELFLSLAFPAQRRTFVLAALALVLLITVFSLINAALGPIVREKSIPMRGLPRAMSGFTIVHISDLHLGNLTSMKRLRRIVAKANSLKPDLVCVTGDTIDGEIGRDGRYCQALSLLQATHGVAAVTGNHEFYAGIDKFMELARCSRWRVLRNESWIIDGRFAVIGLDDDAAGHRRQGEGGPDLEKALQAIPAEMPKVLLYHQPVHFATAAGKGIGLQLSGHTHAGQIPPMDILAWLTYKYPAGLYRLGRSHIYTSSGTSTWGPPMRFLSRSEIVKLILVPEGASN